MRVWRYVAVLGVMVTLTAGARADLNKGLIGAWTFNDGKGTDGVGKSAAQLKDGAKIVDGGTKGKALNVDGVKAHAQIPHVSTYDATANAFTIAAWAFVRQGKDHSAIAFKGEKVGWGPNFLFRMATTSNTNITWGAGVAGREAWFATDNVIQPNKWLHFCQTADGKLVTAYIDGKLPKPTGGDGAFANPNPTVGPYLTFPTKPIELGVGRAVGGTVGNDAYLDGLIDEVYFYNRALTEAEVNQLAAGEGPSLAVDAKGKIALTWGDLKRE